MIIYDRNKWWIIWFSLKGTVVKRMAIRLFMLLCLTALIATLQEHGYHIPKVNSTLHTLLGTGLSLLLVFRTNSSYDRYWEGRKLLGGIVNNSRSLFRAAGTYCAEPPLPLVTYLAGFLTALKQSLRFEKNPADYEESVKDPVARAKISGFAHPGTAALALMSKWVNEQVRKGNLVPWQARSLEQYISVIGESQGGLERIANTPIPFAYAAHTHQFLLLYLVTLPFTMAFTYQYYSLVAVFIIGFGFIGIDEAGVEIEDPFGNDDNDLPLEAIFGVIMRDAKSLAEFNSENSSLAESSEHVHLNRIELRVGDDSDPLNDAE